MLRAHNGSPTPVATNFQKTPDHQSASIAVWSHLSVVRTFVHGLHTSQEHLPHHRFDIFPGVMMASRSVRMSPLLPAPCRSPLRYPITLQSSSPWTHPSRGPPLTSSLVHFARTSAASQAHHIHQLLLRSVDAVSSGRLQIAASAAVGTRLYGRMTRHHNCAARLWTSALRERKAAAEQLGQVSRLTKI